RTTGTWPSRHQRPCAGAPRHGVIDPCVTQEGKSVRSLGHQLYLEAKTKGDNSMAGKAGNNGAHSVVCLSRPGWHGEGCIASTSMPILSRFGSGYSGKTSGGFPRRGEDWHVVAARSRGAGPPIVGRVKLYDEPQGSSLKGMKKAPKPS